MIILLRVTCYVGNKFTVFIYYDPLNQTGVAEDVLDWHVVTSKKRTLITERALCSEGAPSYFSQNPVRQLVSRYCLP